MNNYEEKKRARVERLEERILKLRRFAEGKDLSLFGESKSGIPMGQPILVGHHSERRHRRHLERINNLIGKGYNALKMADRLESKLESIRSNRAIQCDNPDARELIQKKLEARQKTQDSMKFINKCIQKINKVDFAAKDEKINELAKIIESSPFKPKKYSAKDWASELLNPDCMGRIGFASFELSNNNAEIRRLKKRLLELDKIDSKKELWIDFEINEIRVMLIDGQLQVHFPKKPNEATRSVLKRSPISLKWSSYSKAWVRKYTASICNDYYMIGLKKALEGAQYE